MVSRLSRIRREREFPLPHNIKVSWDCSLESSTVNYDTNIAILLQDEARTPGSYFTNPEHASFAEYSSPNCSPNSEVMSIYTSLRVSMTKGALVTDNIDAIRFAFIPIHMAFKEDYTAIDELTSVETQDVLEMTTEATDRQGFPLMNNVKAPAKFSGSSALGADQPGLDTTQSIEGIVFDKELFYDAISHYTIANKLKSIQDGMRWITLTRRNPGRNILIRQKRDTKRMNPYTYNGFILLTPQVDTHEQIPVAGDTTTDLRHVSYSLTTRFLEWNNMFHNERA